MREIALMDSIDRVANVLLGNRGNTYCDSCLAESLAFDVRQVTTALADSAFFQQRFSRCSICSCERVVIASN